MIDKNLDVTIVENATIQPIESKNGKSYSGIFDSNGNVIKDSLLFRKNQQIIFPSENYSIKSYLNDNCYVFAGYLVGHYGHFLLESLARLWYIKQYPELPIIWIPRAGRNFQDFKFWQKEIISLLNITNKIVILKNTSFVKKIIIPQPGCILRQYLSKNQAQALSVNLTQEINKNHKIWLSRSKLNIYNTVSAIYNEIQLESILECQGWHIFHPQEHTVTEQIKMLETAKHIAGFHGSAFHTLVLLDRPNPKVTIFARHDLGQDKIVNDTYRIIAETKKLKQIEHFISLTEIRKKTKNSATSVYMINSYREIIDILNNKED